MTPTEIVKALAPWKKRNERTAWKPTTRPFNLLQKVGLSSPPRTASVFGGVPWLSSHESWPTCQECKGRMAFFLQIDLSTIPLPLRDRYGDGLLQLFYCLSCEGGWEPFSTVSLVRIVPRASLTQLAASAVGRPAFEPKLITEWSPIADHPNPQEFESLGLDITYNFDVQPSTTRVKCDEAKIDVDGIEASDIAEEISLAQGGDKLGGWPSWVQGLEYPSCPKCAAPMQLVFQLGSTRNVNFMLGDCGVGHITQCDTHKDIVAFGWACS